MAARAMRNETRYEKLSTLQDAAAKNDYTQTVGTRKALNSPRPRHSERSIRRSLLA